MSTCRRIRRLALPNTRGSLRAAGSRINDYFNKHCTSSSADGDRPYLMGERLLLANCCPSQFTYPQRQTHNPQRNLITLQLSKGEGLAAYQPSIQSLPAALQISNYRWQTTAWRSSKLCYLASLYVL